MIVSIFIIFIFLILFKTTTTSIHVILIGNKTDLNEKRRVSYESGLELVNEWKNNGSIASFIETSARTGEKVEEVFTTLLSSIDNRNRNQPNVQQENTATKQPQSNNSNNSNKKDCIIS